MTSETSWMFWTSEAKHGNETHEVSQVSLFQSMAAFLCHAARRQKAIA
jgi:hypothetical protein